MTVYVISDILLRGLMTSKNGKADVTALMFRLFEPTGGEEYSPEPQYVFKDPQNSEQSAIYYTLPATGSYDKDILTAFLRHEGYHTALGQSEKLWLHPDVATKVNEACGV